MFKILDLKKTIMFILLIGVLLVVNACSGTESASSSKGTSKEAEGTEKKAKEKVVVAIPFGLGVPSGIPLWLGDALGYYKDEGIDVEVVALVGKPSEAVGLVVAGKADVAITQPDALVYPLAEGKDQGLTWIFSPYQRPIFGIAVKESSNISSPKQLENKTVGMTALGAPFETFMKVNVKADGGDTSSIDSVAIGSGAAAMQALEKGDIDAFVGNQGDLATAALVTGTKTKLLPFPSEVEKGFAAGFVMRKDTNQAKRDAIARYIRSVVKTAIYAKENPDKIVKLNWEKYPASKPTDKPEEQALKEAKVSLGVTVDNYRPTSDGQWGFISEERWKKFIDTNGLSAKIPDVKKLYDYSLLDEINKFDEDAVKKQAKN